MYLKFPGGCAVLRELFCVMVCNLCNFGYVG